MKSRLFVFIAATTLAAGSMLAQEKPQEKDKKDPAADKKKADKNELPLDMTRKLEFETDEGTWMSLDVTPDGKSVVFELLGDLYKVPIGGGDATRVTDGTSYDAQPRVSPDGQWIAFISDRSGSDNLWIVKNDGTQPRKLSNESQDAVISPAWTRDSQYVIASVRATGGTQLRMFHINGGSGIALAGGTPPPAGGPAPAAGAAGPNRLGASVTPDGKYVFVSQAGTGGGLARWQVARLDMQTGDADVITQAEGGGMRPLVSPDGKRLVYATRYETRTGLRIRDLDSGADRWLKWPITRDEQESGGSPTRDTLAGYAFTPDSREVVIANNGKIERIDTSRGTSTPVPFKAKVSIDVGPDLEFPYRVPQGPVRARLIQDPRQSPDGKRLVMSVLTNLYIVDLPASGASTVTPKRLLPAATDNAFKPTWSPDGQWIAFVTWSSEAQGHVWKVRADGSGQPQQLTKVSAFYTDITFSPDGQRIVGLRGNEYQRQQTFSEFGGLRIPLDLVWLPSGGGDVQLIVPARGVGRPHFATDPNRIFVYSDDGLISLRYDGTDRRTHIRVTGPGRSGAPRPPAADAVLMRPDGRWALAEVNNQLWALAVPPFTGSAASVSVRSPSLPAKRLTDIGADYFAWSEDGKAITWAIGSSFFRRAFDTIDFGPAEGAEKPAEGAGKPAEGAEKKPEGQSTEKPGAKPKDPLDLDKNVQRVDVVVELPRATPKGTIVLRGATIITSKGDEVIQNADVLVTDNRITSVGRGIKAPAGTREIDARGKFIVPGFVDTHAHWEFRTHDVLEPQNWSLIANLAYGVTAGLDVQTSTNDYFAYQDLVETGQSIGERAFMTGPGVFSSNDFQSYEATLAYLKRYKEHYRTTNIKSYMVGNRKQRQWVVQAAKELGLMPTTEGGRDMKMDITHAIDGMHGNEHTLPVFPLYKDIVELFAKTKTSYTPTLLVNYGGIIAEEYFYTTTEVHDDKKLNRFYPHNVLDVMTRRRSVWGRKDEFVFPMAAESAAKIQRAGGLVGVGGHGQLQGLGYHWEMWGLAMGGMTPREVLKAATIDGARIIGFDQDLGSIEAGKLADLVVLDRNPLQDIRNTNSIRYVMKNGELYEGDTLDQIWPVQKKLPKFWWWDAAPKAPVTSDK